MRTDIYLSETGHVLNNGCSKIDVVCFFRFVKVRSAKDRPTWVSLGQVS